MRLNELARQQQMIDNKELTFSPNINSKSKILAEDYVPLHKRWQKEVEKKERSMSKRRLDKIKQEEDELKKMKDRQNKIEKRVFYYNDRNDSPCKENVAFYAEYKTEEDKIQKNALSKFILIQ